MTMQEAWSRLASAIEDLLATIIVIMLSLLDEGRGIIRRKKARPKPGRS